MFVQQAEVIRDGTGFNVGHYCGEMGQDFWDARRWQREFETKEVRFSCVCVSSGLSADTVSCVSSLSHAQSLTVDCCICVYPYPQVLVMTAQILLNILRHSIIKMECIHLLILDECHHAVKKHPYSLVMSEFYHVTSKAKRPAVFGMTASPVNLKGRIMPCISMKGLVQALREVLL